MPSLRLIFGVIVLAAPLLCAQDSAPTPADANKTEPKALPAHAPDAQIPAPNATPIAAPAQLPFEPLQITITFIKRRSGRVTIQKTYTMTATTSQSDPQIRDDSRVPYQALAAPGCTTAPGSRSATAETQYFNSNTDVDVGGISNSKDTVSLTLRISIDGIADNVTVPPILRSHRYVISPTIPIGKLSTVYSEFDVVHDTKVEIQLLVQPLNPQKLLPAASPPAPTS